MCQKALLSQQMNNECEQQAAATGGFWASWNQEAGGQKRGRKWNQKRRNSGRAWRGGEGTYQRRVQRQELAGYCSWGKTSARSKRSRRHSYKWKWVQPWLWRSSQRCTDAQRIGAIGRELWRWSPLQECWTAGGRLSGEREKEQKENTRTAKDRVLSTRTSLGQCEG